MTIENNIAYGEVSLLTDQDVYLFNEGTHAQLYENLGAHIIERDGQRGVYYATWAPSAKAVSVVGDFNGWNRRSHPLQPRGSSGIWEGFIPGLTTGERYKYFIESQIAGYQVEKADPFALRSEMPPHTASIVESLDYRWGDTDWMQTRAKRNALDSPMSIYEVHLGSWRRIPEEDRPLSYLELAEQLVAYVVEMGFTHVEFLPVMEHPYSPSWGYQITGYFAPTARFGTPTEFMLLIDKLHQAGIGVILDWVPSHFPTDEHGLGYFDGTHLYEHADPRQGFQPDWHTFTFNYGRYEVRSFLLSNAHFWLDKYHVDALRVDAVASMLYLDYSRKPGEWIPNEHGGNENLEAVYFLRKLNEMVFQHFPDVQTIAEESTSWPLVSRPVYLGGLGFGMKWDMGWMHDTLNYLAYDPIHRSYHQNELTFRGLYAGSENFVMPLSHDEVVHGKGSLVGKMPGDDWQKFANARLLLAWMYGQPGKKLLFMGGELGQWREWNFNTSLDWNLLTAANHSGMQRWVKDLNRFYRQYPALYEDDTQPDGFEWIDCTDSNHSVLIFMRRTHSSDEVVIAAFNFTPVPHSNYRVGVPGPGVWNEALNSDSTTYWGSNMGNYGTLEAEAKPSHGRPYSVVMTLPPLAAVFLVGKLKDSAK
ncbi:MAG: 1,4-alpha-glucan branching protein GlgB [Chloroflexi bacterium]|nr:1,4-alpha-glucan branching protein GlgB [Chloroflexota bacterium]